MRRERKRKKKFRLRNTIGNGKKKTSDEEEEKIESKKDPRWTIVSSSRASQVVLEEKGGGEAGRAGLESVFPRSFPLKKSRKINFDVIVFLIFETSKIFFNFPSWRSSSFQK